MLTPCWCEKEQLEGILGQNHRKLFNKQMRLIKIDKMSRLSSARTRERGKLKMLVNNEISRRVLDVTIDIQ